jgi:hypothetical protein
MATLAGAMPQTRSGDDRFFLLTAVAMTLVIVAGFSLQLAMGRSTFSSPLLVHLHATVFMGWVAIYLTQNILVSQGAIALHRQLGRLAVLWVVAMVVLGTAVTVAIVQRGTVPFFFTPVQFLVFDPLSVVTFAVLIFAGVANRRRTDWHRRLNYCAMSMLLGPAFGRLLPMPLLAPWAFEATLLAVLTFPVIGVIADLRRSGTVHRAWLWGIGTIVGSAALTESAAFGPLGVPLYNAVTAGTPGASVAPLEFPPPPSGPLRTGRPSSI